MARPQRPSSRPEICGRRSASGRGKNGAMPWRALRTVWDRFVASDPGLTRLFTAVLVTLSVAAAVLVTGLAAQAFHIAPAVVVLAAVVAMQTSLSVNDPRPHTTTLLVPLPATLGIVFGALTSAHQGLAEAGFLVVLFAAVAVRRFGQRWTAFGTIATLTYFLALFLGVTVAQLPALIASIAVAVAVTFLLRFAVLRIPPGWTARRTVDAFRARVRLVVADARNVVAAPPTDERTRRALRSARLRLNETALAIEGQLGDEASDVTRAVFDVEIAAENISSAALRFAPQDAARVRGFRVALDALRHGSTARALRLAEKLRSEPGMPEVGVELAEAIVDLGQSFAPLRALSSALESSRGAAPAPPGQQPPLRQALQVTVAAAAAIVAGELISPDHWYWAVLAAYFVFIGTASSGETLVRAWARTVGTALGVALGLLTGHVAQGHVALEVGAIFACLFLGVYALRVSYAMMIFFITALLSLLWALLGRLSDGLLVVRLEETAAGAAFGALAALLLFPTHTHDVVRDAVTETLDAAADVVHASIGRLIDPAADLHPVATARVLDARFQGLVTRAHPIASGAILTGGGKLRRWIVALNAATYLARNLAGVAERATQPPPGDLAALLQRLDEALGAELKTAASRFGSDTHVVSPETLACCEELRRRALDAGPAEFDTLDEALHLIERFDRAIVRV